MLGGAAALAGLGISACATGGDPALRPASPTECTESEGTTTTLTIPAPAGSPLGADVALAHLPPCVDPTSARLVLLFHGSGLRPATWMDEPVEMGVVADRLWTAGEIGEVILVAPGGADNVSFADTALGPLLTEIDAAFGTQFGERQGRITTIGFSLGGPTAVRVALDPAVRADSIVLVASVWRDTIGTEIATAARTNSFAVDRVFLDAGVDDGLGTPIPEQQAAFDPYVDSIKIDRPPGGHNVDYLATRVADWLTWLEP